MRYTKPFCKKLLHVFTTRRTFLCFRFVLVVIHLVSGGLAIAQPTFNSVALFTNMDYAGSGAGTVQVADINSDGYPDIIYNSGPGTGITYLQNNAGTSFSTPSSNPFNSYISSSPAGTTFNNSSSIADFDGDGDLDIWVRVSGADNDVYLRNNNGAYASSSLPAGMEFTGAGAAAVQVADMNRDGFPDIVFNAGAGGGITYLQNNGGSSFSTPVSNPFVNFTAGSPAGTAFNTVGSIFDFDGDGDLDVWARVAGAGNDVFLRNNAGTLESVPTISGLEFTPASGAGAVKVGDFNGDGLPDFLYNTAIGGGIVYFQNNNGASFSTPATNPFASFLASTPAGVIFNTAATVADFDGDGDFDIWVRQAGAGNDFYLAATGSAPRVLTKSPAHNATNVAVNSNIILGFSENIFVGTGSFYIRRISDNSLVETIPVTGANVSGSGSTSITINPVVTLAAGTAYYLAFDRTALIDADGLIPGSLDDEQLVREPAQTPAFLSFTTAAALPVTWSYINADIKDGQLVVNWATVSEQNNDHFEIEGSIDGQHFEKLGQVVTKAEGGNSSQPVSYQFSTTLLTGVAGIAISVLLLGWAGAAGSRRRYRLASLFFGVLVLVIGCSKKEQAALNENGKLYIRLVQVDKDGGKSYSKAVVANKAN